MGGVMGGMSYGRKATSDPNPSRVTVDYAGFNIPRNMGNKLVESDKVYSFETDRLSYKGPSNPSLSIKNDTSIIKNNPQQNGGTPAQTQAPNVVNDVTLDWDAHRPFHLGIEPWITTPVISDTSDGIYLGIVSGETFDAGKNKITLGIRLSTELPEPVFGLVKNRKLYLFKQSQMVSTGTRTFSDAPAAIPTAQASNVASVAQLFKLKEYTDKAYTPEELVGTLIFSTAVSHLYHLRSVDYVEHKALQKFYEALPGLTDKFAEITLSKVPMETYQVMLQMTPGVTALDFLTQLQTYVTEFRTKEADPAKSSILDEILQLIGGTLYKMKRLTDGKKVFSIVSEEDTKYFSDNVKVSMSSRSFEKLVDRMTDAISDYFNKYKKSPVKEIRINDKKQIKQYCRRKMLSGKDASTLIDSVLTTGVGTFKGINKVRRGNLDIEV
jgi:hypothetical protein